MKPHESGRMIACGSANGSVHLMEVSENMTFSAKNDKAILNAVSKMCKANDAGNDDEIPIYLSL